MANFLENQVIPYTPYTPDVDVNALQQENQAYVNAETQRQQAYLATEGAKQQAYRAVAEEKKKEFDNNVQLIQGALDYVGKLPVAREADKAYLQQLVNGLTTKFNSLSAGDYDNSYMIRNTIRTAQQVADDPKVQNAVNGANQYHALVKGWQDIGNDPKAFFSEANYAHDMKQAKAWLSDGTAGKAYTGPTTPTHYLDVESRIGDFVKGIKENAGTPQTDKEGNMTWYYQGRQRSEKQLYEAAEFALGPEYKEQWSRDAEYAYRGYDDNTLASQYNSSHYPEYQAKVRQVTNLKARMGSENDPTNKADIGNQLADAENELKDFEKNNSVASPEDVATNRTEYAYKTYKAEKLNQLAGAYAYEQDKLVKGPGGTKAIVDPNTGVATTPMFSNTVTTQNTTKVDNSEEKIKSEIDELKGSAGAALMKFKNNLYKTNPDMFQTDNGGAAIGAGGVPVHNLKALNELTADQQAKLGTSLLAAKNTIPGFFEIMQMEPNLKNYYDTTVAAVKAKAQGRPSDINKLPDGTMQMLHETQINLALADAKEKKMNLIKNQALNKAGLTPKEKELFASPDLDNADFFPAIGHFVKRLPGTLLSGIGNTFSTVAHGIYDAATGNNPAIQIALDQSQQEEPPQEEVNSVIEKLKGAENNAEVKDILAYHPSVANYLKAKYDRYTDAKAELSNQELAATGKNAKFSENFVKATDLKGVASQLLATRNDATLGDTKGAVPNILSDNIEELSVTHNPDGTDYLTGVVKNYGDSKNKVDMPFSVPIDAALSAKLNLGQDDTSLNKLLMTSPEGRSPIFHTTSDTKVIVPFEIVRENIGDPNDQSVSINIPTYDKFGKLLGRTPFQLPDDGGNESTQVFPNAAVAYKAINNLAVRMRKAGYYNINEFLQHLNNAK